MGDIPITVASSVGEYLLELYLFLQRGSANSQKSLQVFKLLDHLIINSYAPLYYIKIQ